MKKKPCPVIKDLILCWWHDAMTCHDEQRIKGIGDLPLQESAGVLKNQKGMVILLQNKCLTKEVRKDDEVTAIPKKWVKSAVLIRLKFKNGLPESGFQTVEVDL